jgi:hypothetical protein
VIRSGPSVAEKDSSAARPRPLDVTERVASNARSELIFEEKNHAFDYK